MGHKSQMVKSGQTNETPKPSKKLSIKQVRQAVEMLEQRQDRKTVIATTNISSDTYSKLKVIVGMHRVDDIFSGQHTVGSLFRQIKEESKPPPPGVKEKLEDLPSLDKMVLDGIVGISLAQKLAGASDGLRIRFIEDISAFLAGMDKPKNDSVFQHRSKEMDARLQELDRQIKEKEQQIRHLDREIACRRSAETFVRQMRETMTVLRDMELGLSRGDVTGNNFLTPEEVEYHASTLRRIADVMSELPKTERLV